MIEVRRATVADLAAVVRLHQQLGPAEPSLADAEAARIFERMSRYPDYALFVAEEDGAIVGTFVLLIMDKLAHGGRPAGVVEDVVVDERRRGRGIGAVMMRAAMERCRERGCYKLALSSNARREAAHGFYESLGFKRHGFSFQVDL